ncbi:hypothetical protein CJ207_27850, partial [Klebsiella aerogenes]
ADSRLLNEQAATTSWLNAAPPMLPGAMMGHVELALWLKLLAEGKDIETITADVGYSEVSTLLALLRRQTGKGIRALRHAV